MPKSSRIWNQFILFDEAREALPSELRELADWYAALCDMYMEIEEALPADAQERRHWRAQSNKTEVLFRRMEGNAKDDIRFTFKAGTEVKVTG